MHLRPSLSDRERRLLRMAGGAEVKQEAPAEEQKGYADAGEVSRRLEQSKEAYMKEVTDIATFAKVTGNETYRRALQTVGALMDNVTNEVKKSGKLEEQHIAILKEIEAVIDVWRKNAGLAKDVKDGGDGYQTFGEKLAKSQAKQTLERLNGEGISSPQETAGTEKGSLFVDLPFGAQVEINGRPSGPENTIYLGVGVERHYFNRPTTGTKTPSIAIVIRGERRMLQTIVEDGKDYRFKLSPDDSTTVAAILSKEAADGKPAAVVPPQSAETAASAQGSLANILSNAKIIYDAFANPAPATAPETPAALHPEPAERAPSTPPPVEEPEAPEMPPTFQVLMDKYLQKKLPGKVKEMKQSGVGVVHVQDGPDKMTSELVLPGGEKIPVTTVKKDIKDILKAHADTIVTAFENREGIVLARDTQKLESMRTQEQKTKIDGANVDFLGFGLEDKLLSSEVSLKKGDKNVQWVRTTIREGRPESRDAVLSRHNKEVVQEIDKLRAAEVARVQAEAAAKVKKEEAKTAPATVASSTAPEVAKAKPAAAKTEVEKPKEVVEKEQARPAPTTVASSAPSAAREAGKSAEQMRQAPKAPERIPRTAPWTSKIEEPKLVEPAAKILPHSAPARSPAATSERPAQDPKTPPVASKPETSPSAPPPVPQSAEAVVRPEGPGFAQAPRFIPTGPEPLKNLPDDLEPTLVGETPKK